MFSFTHMFNLFMDELSRRRRRRLPFFQIALSALHGFLFGHRKILL
jgi:hypothetical protein